MINDPTHPILPQRGAVPLQWRGDHWEAPESARAQKADFNNWGAHWRSNLRLIGMGATVAGGVAVALAVGGIVLLSMAVWAIPATIFAAWKMNQIRTVASGGGAPPRQSPLDRFNSGRTR